MRKIALALLSTLFLTSAFAAPVRHDVLVLYTDQVIALRGIDNLRAATESYFAWTNQAYVNSGVDLVVVPVGMVRSPSLQEAPTLQLTDTGTALYQDATIRALRDQMGADIVLLVTNDTAGGWTGWGRLWWGVNNGVAWFIDAHAAVRLNGGWDAKTVAHELGHTQGLDHNRENAGSNTVGAYHYGYRLCAVGGFRDIMTYACPGVSVPQIQYFGNPNVTYNGLPTGVDPAVDPVNAAWTARALNENAPIIANFRNPPPPPGSTAPLPPTNFVVAPVSGGARLDWVPSEGADTFRITRETRHKNGKAWNAVTSFSVPGTYAYATDVVRAGTYRYSITAVNAYGTSLRVGPVQVTIP